MAFNTVYNIVSYYNIQFIYLLHNGAGDMNFGGAINLYIPHVHAKTVYYAKTDKIIYHME